MNGQQTGENCGYAWSSGGSQADPRWPVDAWYSEIKDYNFGYPGFSGQTGTYTPLLIMVCILSTFWWLFRAFYASGLEGIGGTRFRLCSIFERSLVLLLQLFSGWQHARKLPSECRPQNVNVPTHTLHPPCKRPLQNLVFAVFYRGRLQGWLRHI